MDRNLGWDGIFNARDLGGLRAADGRTTRAGALVRSDALTRLTEAGWAALYDHDVRTIIDLRNDFERVAGETPRPVDIDLVHLPLDPLADKEFWAPYAESGLHSTPIYYEPLLRRHPHLVADLVSTVTGARQGGVLFHCASGRDRTGLTALLLLALVGVPADLIADDYELSIARTPLLNAALGRSDAEPAIAALLAEHGADAREIVVEVARFSTSAEFLDMAGLADLGALRERLLEAA